MFCSSQNTLCSWALTFQPTLSTCPLVLFPSWQFSFFNFSWITSLLPEILPTHTWLVLWMFCIASLLYFYRKFCLFYNEFFFCSHLWPKSSLQNPCLFSCIQNINLTNRANCNSIYYHQNMLTTQHTLFFSKSITKTKIPALAFDAVGYV